MFTVVIYALTGGCAGRRLSPLLGQRSDCGSLLHRVAGARVFEELIRQLLDRLGGGENSGRRAAKLDDVATSGSGWGVAKQGRLYGRAPRVDQATEYTSLLRLARRAWMKYLASWGARVTAWVVM